MDGRSHPFCFVFWAHAEGKGWCMDGHGMSTLDWVLSLSSSKQGLSVLKNTGYELESGWSSHINFGSRSCIRVRGKSWLMSGQVTLISVELRTSNHWPWRFGGYLTLGTCIPALFICIFIRVGRGSQQKCIKVKLHG